MEQELHQRCAEDHAVKSVQHPAVAGKNIAVVLQSVLSLNIGKGQVADLGHHAPQDAVDRQKPVNWRFLKKLEI